MEHDNDGKAIKFKTYSICAKCGRTMHLADLDLDKWMFYDKPLRCRDKKACERVAGADFAPRIGVRIADLFGGKVFYGSKEEED